MLGMAVRGWDEAATALTEALHIAQQINRPAYAADALGVRAGVEMMRADYASARHCAQAGLSMSDDPGARSVNLMFLAAIDADTGDFESAAGHASAAGSAAQESGDPVRILYAAAHTARIHLMMGDTSAARTELGKAGAAGDGTMLALRPWSMSMLAEVELAERNLDAARRAANEAATLAATTNITYQRALACRAIGLAESACGDSTAALAHLTEALSHARRTTGEGYMFHWPVAFVLDSLAEVTAVHDPPAAQRWASALLDHATAIGMNHFAARARQRLAGNTVGTL
jgi:tetratricopeptide (TPR) repeat protein